MIFQLETRVVHFDIWDHKIEHENQTKTISKWLSDMVEVNMSYDEMKPLREKIMKVCNEQSYYEQRSM